MKVTIAAVVLIIGVVAVGGGFLVTWDIPPPTKQVEKVIPNDQFPR